MIVRFLRVSVCAVILGGAVTLVDRAFADDRLVIRAPAAPAPALRREAIVEADIVTLGDLVDRCGSLCATPLFAAPQPGESGTIQAQRVAAAARDAGLGAIDASAASQTIVTRAGRAASTDEIAHALAKAIGESAGVEAADIEPTLDRADIRLLVGTGAGSGVALTDLTVEPRIRRFTASLAPASARHATPLRVSGFYAETALTPVLTRPVQRGDSITAGDIAMERRNREAIADEAIVNAAEAVGRVARIAMRAGAILRDRDLAKPILVDRNAIVTVVLEAGALQLTLKGKALDQGAMGDTISVQNVNSKRVIQAIVIGHGMARIPTAAAVARTAAARP